MTDPQASAGAAAGDETPPLPQAAQDSLALARERADDDQETPRPRPGERFIVAQPGGVEHATGYDAWINSENAALDVSRMIDRSISAAIRRLGAIWTGDGRSEDKEAWGDLVEDTIKDALREAVGFQRPAVGDVYATTAGALQWQTSPSGVAYGVKRIYHVISVDAYQNTDQAALELCLTNLFARIDSDNRRLVARMTGGVVRSVLIPLIGAGRGGRRNDEVIDDIVRLSLKHFADNPRTEIRLIGVVTSQREASRKLLGMLQTQPRFAARDCGPEAEIR